MKKLLRSQEREKQEENANTGAHHTSFHHLKQRTTKNKNKFSSTLQSTTHKSHQKIFSTLLMSNLSTGELRIYGEQNKNGVFMLRSSADARNSLMCRRTKKRRYRIHHPRHSLLSIKVPAIFIFVITCIVYTQGLSSSPSNNSKAPPPPYKSRSTSIPDEASKFAEGSDVRRDRLHEALSTFGIDASALTGSAEYRGSAALRAYSSFILPKSAGALAVAESPQRAAVVANNIAFLIREHKSHQEEWLRNHDRSIAEAEEILGGAPRQPLTLVLDNVRSAHNVGNILRAAEAARVSNVVLCGITPGPPNSKVLKTALGAAEYVPHAHFGSTLDAVRDLQRQGVTVWACETTSKSQPMWETEMPQPLALVFGNELVGIEADVLEQCDGLVCIPTHGVKNSLNVATCASIVMWEAFRQWDSKKNIESS